MAQLKQLDALITPHLSEELPRKSRCHPLQGYIQPPNNSTIWIKREDELNPTAIGSKLRKYLSLLPYLELNGSREVILIGGSNSNNVLGLSQVLKALGIGVSVIVKKPRDTTLRGHWLFLNLLLPSDRIHSISAEDWPNVTGLATQLADQLRPSDPNVAIIPEGGDHLAALSGILTVAVDLIRNETDHNCYFDHIWTDAGTGISAIGLVLGLHFLGQQNRTIHITLIAGTEREFEARYSRFQKELERLTGKVIPDHRPKLHFVKPATAAAFGSLNSTTLHETTTIARETGLLMDPVYSVKHLYTMKQVLQQTKLQGTHLFMYNGGTQGLNGFQSRLAPLIEQL